MSTKIEAKVQRGENKGEILAPHLHDDNTYVVSMTRFEADYIRVSDIQSVINALRSGLRLRMSGRDVKTAPSLILPTSITVNGAAVSFIQK